MMQSLLKVFNPPLANLCARIKCRKLLQFSCSTREELMAITEAMSLCMALVLCMLGQVSGSDSITCGVDARPHPEGLCGDYLIRAHRNLCARLRNDYPHLFPKRSVDQFPLTSITSMYLFAEGKRASSKDLGEYDLDLERQKRQGMVCECCYNQCVASQLALYC